MIGLTEQDSWILLPRDDLECWNDSFVMFIKVELSNGAMIGANRVVRSKVMSYNNGDGFLFSSLSYYCGRIPLYARTYASFSRASKLKRAREILIIFSITLMSQTCIFARAGLGACLGVAMMSISA